MAHDVFISYAKNDREVADAICAGLKDQGIRCWMAPRNLVAGEDWGPEIVDAKNCRSNSYPLTFEVKRTAAAARDRSLEINTPQGFKFKIPR